MNFNIDKNLENIKKNIELKKKILKNKKKIHQEENNLLKEEKKLLNEDSIILNKEKKRLDIENKKYNDNKILFDNQKKKLEDKEKKLEIEKMNLEFDEKSISEEYAKYFKKDKKVDDKKVDDKKVDDKKVDDKKVDDKKVDDKKVDDKKENLLVEKYVLKSINCPECNECFNRMRWFDAHCLKEHSKILVPSKEKKKNIFCFGSCRARNNKYSYHNLYGPPYSHNIKSALQMIDFFNNPDKFNQLEDYIKESICWPEYDSFEKIRFNYFNADIILLELTSLKITTISGYHYTKLAYKRRLGKEFFSSLMSEYVQSYDDLINDLNKFKDIIKKPVIVQGHANLIFNGIEDFKTNNYRIKNRELIDKAIIESVDENKRIIINEVLGNFYDQKHWRDTFNTVHYTDEAYGLLADKLFKIVKNLFL